MRLLDAISSAIGHGTAHPNDVHALGSLAGATPTTPSPTGRGSSRPPVRTARRQWQRSSSLGGAAPGHSSMDTQIGHADIASRCNGSQPSKMHGSAQFMLWTVYTRQSLSHAEDRHAPPRGVQAARITADSTTAVASGCHGRWCSYCSHLAGRCTGGKLVYQYVKKAAGPAKCGVTGARLNGVSGRRCAGH